jgi:hypothetical protein
MYVRTLGWVNSFPQTVQATACINFLDWLLLTEFFLSAA